ncbi:YihY/virulence factor BrkB family protein [Coraliomargarita parva]|uniref:YihY/virulence factor BrkB family protein n=1 Tax=Coraliomargarita parva TaxID=3014050 RepID=UPI0022B5246E|nr:YihY/virulence factor BrkB family protein [Coraliomargarita parva]
MNSKVSHYVQQTERLLSRDIWELEHLGRKTARARLYMLLRVLTLTWQGLRRNNIPVQAAALTFYSLIGIGPLIALGIMISGFIIDQSPKDASGMARENLAIEALTNAIAFAAPQLELATESSDSPTAGSELGEEMKQLINGFIAKAQSGTVGVLGTLMLCVIGIQVLTSIEKSFNTLWGAERGRKLGERVVTYWTFMSLGAVLGAAALTLNVLPKVEAFMGKLPLGTLFTSLIQICSPIIAFIILTTLLAVFFRFIPNTPVQWKPAFIGATLVVVLLHLYNLLSFLYVQRVVDTRSLYGSVGIIIVLMLGLFTFWLLILLGGQVTYAVQNADFLTNENAWQRISERSKEVVSLGVLLCVAQRFQHGLPPIRSSELHQKLRVPSHILNTCVTRLCSLGYLYPVEGNTAEEERDRAYQAGKPVDSITLGRFKNDFESYGNNEGVDLVAETSPAIRSYLEDIVSLKDCGAAETKISDLVK